MSPPAADLTADTVEVDGDLGLVIFDERGRRFVPLKTRLVLGRDDDCDVVLSDPRVSRRHAYVFGTTPPTVVDADSKLGTRLGDRTLAPGERAPLPEGVTLWLGGTCITLGRQAPSTIAIPAGTADGAYIVESSRMKALFELATLAARSPLAVLIHGESGSGKELVAECIHRASGRKGLLVRINCAAMAESLLEAELFGYERGAFTGATTSKPGLLETAHKGTLFLDEVADMSAGLQAKLLRVLENGDCTRLGSVTPRRIDARIVAASHKSLEDLCERGAFREDLLYRLAGIKLEVPPLRDRHEDVVPLARRFLTEHGREGLLVPALSPEAESWLIAQPWPGNVRELRAAVLRAAIFSRGSPILLPSHLETGSSAAPRRSELGAPSPPQALRASAPTEQDSAERARIEAALEEAGHNQTRAAALLGMSRRTLVRRLSELGFRRPRGGISR